MVSSGLVFLNLIILVIYNQSDFRGNNSQGPFQLSDKIIFSGTDSVFVNDTFISRDNYMIDYNQGLISFREAIKESSRVTVKFRTSSLAINRKYFRQVYEKADTINLMFKKDSMLRDTFMSDPIEELEFVGAKTFSVNTGSKQGFGFDQATRLDIRGSLAGVNVSAVLSDVGNPIPAEGTTKELTEFDKIQIKVESEKFKAYYGDNDLNQSIGSIGTIRKRLIGVLFNTYFDKSRVNLGYAKSKGIFKRIVFNGQNSKQGPYYLTKNINGAAVIPGTEVIYLQGKRMTRGSSEDYTIDYSKGAVFFTNRNIVNSFSRFECNFEYATDHYNRYSMFVENKWQLNNQISFNAQVILETDDKLQNLFYDLSSADIEYLSSVSGESNQVWLSGVKFVGVGNGDYVLENDYFVFSGIDSGSYDVRFSYIGTNLGDYDYDNLIAGFRYVGANQGKYIAKVRITLPEQNRIYNANFSYRLPAGIVIGLEGFISQRKLNLFAQDNYQNGFAYHLTSTYVRDKFSIQYKHNVNGRKFYFPYARKEVDFEFNWQGTKPESLHESNAVEFTIKPSSFVQLNAGASRLNAFNNIKQERYYYGGKFTNRGDISIFNWQITCFPKSENRYYLNLTPQFKIFYPAIEMFYQNNQDSVQRYFMPSLSMKFNQEINLNVASDFKEIKQSLTKKHQTYKIETELNKDIVSFNGIFGYQTNLVNTIRESADWFGNLMTRVRLFKGLDIFFDYLQKQAEMKTMELNYVWVGQGLGNYKRNPETNQYYYDLNGDYVQEYIQSENFVINNSWKFLANWDFYKWSMVNFDGYLAFDYETRGQTIYMNTKNNRYLNVSILPFAKSFSMKLNNVYDYTKDDQYYNYANVRMNNNHKIELNVNQLEEIPFALCFEDNRQLIERINQGIEQKRIDKIFKLKPNIEYNLNFQVELILVRAQIEKPLNYMQLGKFHLTKSEVIISKNWQIDKLSNLNTFFSLTQRIATIDNLPFDINLTEPKGMTPQMKIGFERIIESKDFNQIMLQGFYSILKYPDRAVEHNLSIKMQVNF